jgi:hypothetical protein
MPCALDFPILPGIPNPDNEAASPDDLSFFLQKVAQKPIVRREALVVAIASTVAVLRWQDAETTAKNRLAERCSAEAPGIVGEDIGRAPAIRMVRGVRPGLQRRSLTP